jgi:hypothetical protein
MRSHLSRRAAALVSVLAPALMLLLAPAAWADGSLNGGDAVLWNGCRDYATHYTVSHPGASSWDMTVTAYDPQGSETDQYYVAGSGASASGTQPLRLCGDEDTGWYDLRAEVTYYDDLGDYLDSEYVSGTLHLTPMPTRTAVQARSLRDGGVAVRVKSSLHKYAGWKRNHDGFTALYAECGSHGWQRVRGTRHLADRRGLVVHRLSLEGLSTVGTPHDRTCKVRAVRARTLPTYRSQESWSPVLNVKHGRFVLHARHEKGRPTPAR